MKQTMSDLKLAILAVLQDAVYATTQFHTDDCDNRLVVDYDLMKTLQAEYNIYFVEPDEEQVNLI